MGRRALRKIDPSIDLTGHLKTFDELPRPWDATTLFGRVAALEVEVGSGKGLFLRTAAAARPEVDFLGIEVAQKYAQFAAVGLAKAGLKNGMVVHGDAVRLFRELLSDQSLSAVHVYFPDPWWKLRHKRRRVMRESFLHDVERTLRPAGPFHFCPDFEDYFQPPLKLPAPHSPLPGPPPVPEPPAENDMAYRTHFERRVRQANEPVFRAEFRRETGGKRGRGEG
jgi:tRNA (guanine-N7-)-methyltransferase